MQGCTPEPAHHSLHAINLGTACRGQGLDVPRQSKSCDWPKRLAVFPELFVSSKSYGQDIAVEASFAVTSVHMCFNIFSPVQMCRDPSARNCQLSLDRGVARCIN
jgi:hypothetical protein